MALTPIAFHRFFLFVYLFIIYLLYYPITQSKPHPTPAEETNNTKAKSHRASGVSGSRIKNTITINTKRQSQISINCFAGKGIFTYSHTHIWYFYSAIYTSVFSSVVEKKKKREVRWEWDTLRDWDWDKGLRGGEQVGRLVEFAVSRQADEVWGDCF